MKKAISFILSLLVLTFVFVGCGSKDTGNVSDHDNGVIEDDTAARSGVERSAVPDKDNRQRNRSIGQDVMDGMKDTAKDAGDTVRDIGRDINDALDNKDTTADH